jgi:hypothetical protein
MIDDVVVVGVGVRGNEWPGESSLVVCTTVSSARTLWTERRASTEAGATRTVVTTCCSGRTTTR